MELWRCYRFVCFVRKQVKIDARYAMHAFLLTRFKDTKHKWWVKRFTAREVRDIIDYAISKGYLERYEEGRDAVVRVTMPKGRDLLDFPFGTMQAFLHEYGLVVSFLTGSFFTAALLAVTGLALRLFRTIIGV